MSASTSILDLPADPPAPAPTPRYTLLQCGDYPVLLPIRYSAGPRDLTSAEAAVLNKYTEDQLKRAVARWWPSEGPETPEELRKLLAKVRDTFRRFRPAPYTLSKSLRINDLTQKLLAWQGAADGGRAEAQTLWDYAEQRRRAHRALAGSEGTSQ